MNQDNQQSDTTDNTQYVNDYFDEQEGFEDRLDPSTEIAWQASEYIHHHKSTLWYIIFVLSSILLAAGFYAILRDITILILIIVMSTALFVFANRKPRTLSYSVSNLGIAIDQLQYSYNNFKSFSIMQDSGIFSIELDPLQRFRPAISIYFDPNDGERIIDVLSTYLPVEERTPDIIDRLIRLARF